MNNRKIVLEPQGTDAISLHPSLHTNTAQTPAPAFICKTGLSTFRLELGWLPALWGCRGLFGRMWTQRPVSHRRGWPETYWILGAEPGALGQSGRLRVSCAGLELRQLQEPKRGVLSTGDGLHPWVVGVEMGWVGGEHLQCSYQHRLFCGYSRGRFWEVFLSL